MNSDRVQMKNNLLQMFKVQVEETYEMTEKAISLTERLDKLKNLMRAQGILTKDADRFFFYLDSMIRLHRDGGNLWIYLPTKKGIDVLNKLGNATTEKEVESILTLFYATITTSVEPQF
jgi:malate synthase